MAAHKYYETMKGKDGIGIQYVYYIVKKGKRIVTGPLPTLSDPSSSP